MIFPITNLSGLAVARKAAEINQLTVQTGKVSSDSPCQCVTGGDEDLKDACNRWKREIERAREKALPELKKKYGKSFTLQESEFINTLANEKNKQLWWKKANYDKFIAINNKYDRRDHHFQDLMFSLKRDRPLFSLKGQKFVDEASWSQYMSNSRYRKAFERNAQEQHEEIGSRLESGDPQFRILFNKIVIEPYKDLNSKAQPLPKGQPEGQPEFSANFSLEKELERKQEHAAVDHSIRQGDIYQQHLRSIISNSCKN
jgi:hypothetical protein